MRFFNNNRYIVEYILILNYLPKDKFVNIILNFPLDGIVNKLAYFKKVASLIWLVLLNIKRSESALTAGILAGSLFMTSPYANAKESMQLNPLSKESGQELIVNEKPQDTTRENTSLKIEKPSQPEASAVTKANLAYYVPIRSYSLQLQTEPPRYVKQVNKTWLKDIEGLQDVDWLDLGVEARLRYEYRDNEFRRTRDVLDQPLYLRTRLFAAVKNKFDPLRATIELQDSRRYNSQFANTNLEVNAAEIIQGYGELYFKDALGTDDLGNDRPLSVKAGRLAFEMTDKRLVARNEFRNTTNTFQGLRVTLGQKNSDWQADMFAFNPVIRFMDREDKADQANWFYGAVGDWRKWSKVITLQPYYYLLQQDGSKVQYAVDGTIAPASAHKNREINTAGLRGYGVVGKTGLDYDFNYARQWGKDGGLDHDAYTYSLETGYTTGHPWKPRFSGNTTYVTGDKNPNDITSQRFERLFGFNRPLSNNDYALLTNIQVFKLRTELNPTDTLKMDFGYTWIKLASATDAWVPGANLRDPTGKSGKDVGQEFDIRLRYLIRKNMALKVGYAYFMAGDFTKKTSNLVEPGRNANSNFLYVETTVTAF
jgi:hypothetical protein